MSHEVSIPHDLAERLRERTRAMVGELIPDEAITKFVNDEIAAMLTVKSARLYNGILEKTDHYGRDVGGRLCGAYEDVTPIQALIRTVLHDKLVERIQKELNSNRGDWSGSMPTASDFAREVTSALVPDLVKAMFEGLVQNTINQMRPR